MDAIKEPKVQYVLYNYKLFFLYKNDRTPSYISTTVLYFTILHSYMFFLLMHAFT